MKSFGLIGYPLEHSFSKSYFENKFLNENIKDVEYLNFECQNLDELFNSDKILKLEGFNITTPYKESIITFLDKLSHEARTIGAVNCVKKVDNKLIGYNTDYVGFFHSIKPKLNSFHKSALVLGNGGASKAVTYALNKLNIKYKIVSRNSSFDYTDLNKKCFKKYQIIINCTPLGTFPNIQDFPKIPYQFLSEKHLLFDLIYNPKISRFLELGIEKNCKIQNGMEMLRIQAEYAWIIWNNKKYTY